MKEYFRANRLTKGILESISILEGYVRFISKNEKGDRQFGEQASNGFCQGESDHGCNSYSLVNVLTQELT